MITAAREPGAVPIAGLWQVVPVFTRLRWRLLRANLRGPSSLAWSTALSIIAAASVGIIGGSILWVTGRAGDRPDDAAPIAMALLVVVVAVLGLAAGVAQAVDPRVLSTEALSSRDASLGQLVLVVTGPAGFAGACLGLGLLVGWFEPGASVRDLAGMLVALAAIGAWLFTMLLASRGATALLGLLAVRRPRTGQLVAGFTVLGAYVASQVLPAMIGDLDDAGSARLAGWARWTPPGQLGDALVRAPSEPEVAMLHLWLGALWIPLLAWGTHVAMERLRTTPARPATSTGGNGWGWRAVRWACRSGPIGALAYRTVLVRVRTPREVLQIVVGTAVGVGVAVGPVFATSGGTSSVVLIGASIQLTILITAGNTFGLDGPALASELLAGADGRTMARAKARSTLIVGLPLVAIPVVPAALTGGWFLLPAGVLVAAGALMAGTGGAVAQSAYAPIALPDTDNPFASGDTGRGCLVGVLTFTSLVVQTLLAAPVGLLLYLALPDMDAPWVTLLAAAAIPVGWAVLATGTRLAARHVDRHGPDLIVAITPSR